MLNKKKTVSIIGSGFSGLAAACYAAKDGHRVQLFEKNAGTGGRARKFEQDGFLFDMGPSWYWMPDVFERFFNDFQKSASDYYHLVKLDPGFQIFYESGSPLQLPASLDSVFELFESIEKGSADKLRKFLQESEDKYRIGMLDFAYKPSLSWREFANVHVLRHLFKTDLFKPMSRYVRQFFKDERLIKLMEFPVLFLGAMPDRIPALYSLMNYSAISQGTFYPMGGMYKIAEGMTELAKSLGVEFLYDHPVSRIVVQGNRASGLESLGKVHQSDAIIASADYHHVEKHLLKDVALQNYSDAYWQKKTMAPSCLIFYVGVKKRIKNLLHHNLFFDSNFGLHASEIYDQPKWPENPLFYVCCPSKTDPVVAPEGMENLFILVPVASGLKDDEATRESYFNALITRIEKQCGDRFAKDIVYKKSYCINNFIEDYNSFKGNAYGLANTLRQTAFLKPSLKNNHIKNLYYAGQLTVPGPGVPPALVSGKIAAECIQKQFVG